MNQCLYQCRLFPYFVATKVAFVIIWSYSIKGPSNLTWVEIVNLVFDIMHVSSTCSNYHANHITLKIYFVHEKTLNQQTLEFEVCLEVILRILSFSLSWVNLKIMHHVYEGSISQSLLSEKLRRELPNSKNNFGQNQVWGLLVFGRSIF